MIPWKETKLKPIELIYLDRDFSDSVGLQSRLFYTLSWIPLAYLKKRPKQAFPIGDTQLQQFSSAMCSYITGRGLVCITWTILWQCLGVHSLSHKCKIEKIPLGIDLRNGIWSQQERPGPLKDDLLEWTSTSGNCEDNLPIKFVAYLLRISSLSHKAFENIG